MSVIRTLVSILLLRSGPQDLPFSQNLLVVMLFLYITSGVLVLQDSVDSSHAAANMIVDLLVMLFFTYIVLTALDHKPRFVQTMTAMAGVGVLFHLLAWPLLMQAEMVEEAEALPVAASLTLLMILSWNLLVVSYIYRQALQVTMTNSILLSFALFFLSMTVSQLILPES